MILLLYVFFKFTQILSIFKSNIYNFVILNLRYYFLNLFTIQITIVLTV